MTHYLSMLVFGKLRLHVTLHKQEYGSNFLHFVSACSGKSQLSNYANANYLKISIWTWFMSYHVKTTLCHDITTYDISIYRGSPTSYTKIWPKRLRDC